MKLSKESRRGARLLFNAACPNGVLDESKVRQVLASVEQRKPSQSDQILHEFQRLVRLQIERHTATVETAVPLDLEQQAQVQAMLAQRFGVRTSAGFSVNPSLIAGMRVKVGSDVYDSNVKERLARLQNALTH